METPKSPPSVNRQSMLLDGTNNKSKIPRFSRSQSLRLSGEKLNVFKMNYGGHESVNRISLTLAGLRPYGFSEHLLDEKSGDGMTQSLHSSTSTLTKKSSLNNDTCANSRRSALKQKNHCQKINSPSEYGSLPSTPVPSPDAEDAESVKSFRSFYSAMSLDTYTSHGNPSRKKKYVVHCPAHHQEEEEYLTPTQRKDRLIRHLKAVICKAKRELEEKDAEIQRLTKEVMDFRGCNPTGMKSPITGDKDPSTLDKNISYNKLNELFKSTKDSGHYEQSDGPCTTSPYDGSLLVSTSCKDEATNTLNESCASCSFLGCVGEKCARGSVEAIDALRQREVEELKRQHSNEYQELKEKYNDRIENLLQKLTDSNTRYFEMRPEYDRAQEQIRRLEKQISVMEKDIANQDVHHHQMYLKMYKKGQEAARFEHADEVLEFAHHAPSRVSVPELLRQLQVTEHELEHVKALYRREIYKQSDNVNKDAEITLRFLKDAIYHFLTNKDSRDHLRAIESIMGYNELERSNIERNIYSKNKLM